MKTITKNDFSKDISENLGISHSLSEQILTKILDGMINSIITNKKLHIKNFGTFEVFHKKSRPGRDILKNQEISIPDKNVVRFSATRSLRNKINLKS